MENLTGENIAMKNVAGAITITSHYPKIPATDGPQPVTDTTPQYRNITIRNLAATSTKDAGYIVGLPECPIENVLLENIAIKAQRAGLEIRHARGVTLKNVQVSCEKGEPLVARDAEISGGVND